MSICDLCGIYPAVDTLPQRGTFDDLEICDDCAVGRRDKLSEASEGRGA
jgi:hypothetical protein